MATTKKENGQSCSNCGQPATQVTTDTGSNTDYYCDACAAQSYPDGANLGPLDAATE